MKYTKDNPLRCFFGFAGYDSQALAFNRLKEIDPEFDYTIVGWSEIDPYAIKAHNALFPEAADKNYGDICNINWDEVPDFDFMTYSSPCFPAGTLVLTKDGYKAIETLSPTDMVLTRDASWKRVEKLGSDGKKPIFRMSAMGVLDIECTANHPFLVRTRKRVWHNDIRRWRLEFNSEPTKMRVQDMTIGESFIGLPIIKDEIKLDMTDELLWLLGRYVADGHCCKKDKVIILSVGASKIDEFESKVTMDHRIFHHTKSCYRATFYSSSPLYKLIATGFLGHGAGHKYVNPLILSAEKSQLKAFLDGYMSGDGSFIKSSSVYEATTISKELALSLVLAVQKVYGVGCKIYFDEKPKTYVIEGRTVNQNNSYMVRWRIDSPKHQWFNDGDFIWYPVKGIEDTGKVEDVFNITVEGNHTYTVNNACVFNCQDFSNAGKQAGGEEGSGTRSSLLWEVRKAVIAKRPKYLMMENVRALVSQKFLPLFQKWEQELASYGYNNYCKVLNARDYGIPQNRERIFVVSILDEERGFTFGDPFELKLRLKDMLEDKVDEKYYLDQERVNKFIENLDDEKKRLLEDDGSGDLLSDE